MSEKNLGLRGNFAWLTAEKLGRSCLTTLVFLLLARQLGPDEFGQLNYAIAIAAIFTVITTFGMQGIVVRELCNGDLSEEEIIGSSLFLSLGSGLIAYCTMVGTFAWLGAEDGMWMILSLAGATVITKSYQVLVYWYEANILLKKIVWAELTVLLLGSGAKIYIAEYYPQALGVAYIILAEGVGLFALVSYAFHRSAIRINCLKFDFGTATFLIRESWPLLISSGAWIIYTRIDHIMIGHLLKAEDVGVYSAASRLSEAMNLLPLILIASVAPAITKQRPKCEIKYLARFQAIYEVSTLLAVFAALSVFAFGSDLIKILLGEAYQESSSVFIILMWSNIFISMAIVSGRYLINERLQRITMYRHLFGVACNIFMNTVFIPMYGVNGAALSTLLSLFLANYILDAFFERTRVCFSQKTRSFLPVSSISIVLGRN
jgi:O-antigen/teichoic acid export membrane protein